MSDGQESVIRRDDSSPEHNRDTHTPTPGSTIGLSCSLISQIKYLLAKINQRYNTCRSKIVLVKKEFSTQTLDLLMSTEKLHPGTGA
jgi:hypothetical protein